MTIHLAILRGLSQIPRDGLLRLKELLEDEQTPLIFDGSIHCDEGY